MSRFNNASKADINRGPSDLDVETYTNDRRSAIDVIYPDNDTDRFWLKVNPANPKEALLFPGMKTRLDWSKLRTVTADHPLSHHFHLEPGEGVSVHRPAVLRKVDGQWVLDKKGTVSGVST